MKPSQNKVRKKIPLRWWIRTYALALRRKLDRRLRGAHDPYPRPPEGICLSPSLDHVDALGRAPLALTWNLARRGDAKAWQQEVRHCLTGLLGAERDGPVPEARCPEETGMERGLRRRRVYLRVARKRDVPVYLLQRGPLSGRAPVLLYLCGSTSGVHVGWGEARIPADYLLLGVKADMARQAAERGYLVVCIEQACYGEREERHLHPRSVDRSVDAANHALLLGRCLLGEQVADVSSVVDWLLSDVSGIDVDPDRLYLFGHSSGGTIAVHTAAVDTRIRAAVCSGCLGPIRETIATRRNPGGTAVVPGILRWMEMSDVVALCAPRPFIGISGVRDHIYPFSGVQAVVEAARDVYRTFEAEDRIHAVSGPRGHQYYPGETWEAADRVLGRPGDWR